jgi:hypothetical protein
MIYDFRGTTDPTVDERLALEVFDRTRARFADVLGTGAGGVAQAASRMGERAEHQARVAFLAAVAEAALAQLEELEPDGSAEVLADWMAERRQLRVIGS